MCTPLRTTLCLGLLALASCATARPAFEQSFGPSETSLRQWLQLLSTRYGCDSLAVRANLSRFSYQEPPRAPSGLRLREDVPSGVRPDMGVCQELAMTGVWPATVRGWSTANGVREEWAYEARSISATPGRPGAAFIVYLAGSDPRTLRVVSVAR